MFVGLFYHREVKMGFEHDIPQEFSDEDRFPIYRQITLPKKSFLTLLIGIGLTYVLYRLTSAIHLSVAGIVVGFVLTIVAVVLTLFPLPEEEYIKGGGLTLDLILLRRMVRRRSRLVYAKGISNMSVKSKN